MILFVSVAAYPLVLHPDGEPLAIWQDRPSDAVAARIGSCSGTVVDPQYVITVSHCAVSMSTPIQVAGRTYYPEAIYTHPSQDIRLIKVFGANFTEYVPISKEASPFEGDPVMVIAGWGRTRGHQVYATSDPNIPVGYAWSVNYGQLKWGTARIDSYSQSGMYTKFKGLDNPKSTPYECAMALYDSGCGMYRKVDGQWFLVAIGRKVIDEGFDFYRDRVSGAPDYGTLNIYLQVRPFLGWINSILYGADINEDGKVDYLDLEELTYEWLYRDSTYNFRADLNRDGIVNLADASILASSWTLFYSPGDITRNGHVDFEDLTILMQQWLEPPQEPSADIAHDGIINLLDFSILSLYWQE